MSFRFYPTIESRKDLEKKLNIATTEDYHFFCCNEFGTRSLSVASGKIKDTLWDPSKDSLRICRNYKINNPEYLYGKDGIACNDASVGISIVWSNPETSMSGCIMPLEETGKKDRSGWRIYFEHDFKPGELKGVLNLKIVIYLETMADTIQEGEYILNNKPGIILGELESYRLQISDETLPFPFVIDKYDTDALWWVDFYEWDDPAEDTMFGPSTFTVNLNSKCKGCPRVTESGIQNQEMMYEIAASVYAMLFKKLSKTEFREMQLGKGKAGTISSELKRVYDLSKYKFDYLDEYSTIQKNMQEVIRHSADNSGNGVKLANE